RIGEDAALLAEDRRAQRERGEETKQSSAHASQVTLPRRMPSPSSPVALIVEDDDQICYILRFILEREGFTVHIARDGNAAQALIEKLAPPAIVTLDVMLPHADGFALLKRIRAHAGWEAVPVI